MLAKRLLAVLVVFATVIGLALATYELQVWSAGKVAEVEGGAIIFESADQLTIRCLSPDMKLDTNGFSGRVTMYNSFPDCVLQGYDGEVTRNGTVLSFDLDGGKGEYRLVAPEKQDFSFAVMGDSQGHNDIIEEALNMTTGCDFVIHCGDLTPSGGRYEFAAVNQALNTSEVPVFTTPGNHDVKNYGPAGYLSTFGPTQYAFDYGGIRFAFVDSSDLNITAEQISWLAKTFSGANRKVIVTHAPSYDPFEGNHTLDPASCERIQDFALENGVTAVFTGHIHAYYILRVDNTDFVITGGVGGSLTAGTYHWLRVNVTSDAFAYERVDILCNSTLPPTLTLKGHGMTQNLSLEELNSMQQVEGDSSYQNQFGNIAGTGHYKGVTVSSLLDLVGGISEGEILRITATDGYYQDFGYGNVNPNSTWLAFQGPMIVALSFDGSTVPDWQDGPRVAMLPSDGLYNNSDCSNTSYPGQGYDLYPSAGARWVKNVAIIEVVS
jgi:predicted phosphodiesterase